MINFFGTEEAKVLFKTEAPPEQEQFAEHLLFASFSLRQFHNLGKRNKAARSMAELLSIEIVKQESASSIDSFCIAQLTSRRDSKGEKNFAGDLTFGEGRALFQLHTEGFNILGVGTDYYASQSILVLLNFLSIRRNSDFEYLRKLFWIASKCGELHLLKKISSFNQSRLAVSLVLEGTSK